MKTDINSEKFSRRFELFVAIFLGLTAVLTAYASWQSALWGGDQATNYTKGNAYIADANQYYNEASQNIAQDTATWNEISGLRIDLAFAESSGNADEVERISYKLNQLMYENVSADDALAKAIEWADAQEGYASPFEMEGFIDGYYTNANTSYNEGWALIDSGAEANRLGDIQGLVTVVLAVVLFMLGIVSTFHNMRTKMVVSAVSFVALMFGIVIMLGVPFHPLG